MEFKYILCEFSFLTCNLHLIFWVCIGQNEQFQQSPETFALEVSNKTVLTEEEKKQLQKYLFGLKEPAVDGIFFVPASGRQVTGISAFTVRHV